MPRKYSRAALGAALPLTLLLASCGGGGTSTNYEGSILSGHVLMGAGQPVNGNGTGNVCLYAVTGGLGNPLNTTISPATSTGTLLTSSCFPTDANGNFSVNLTSFYGPVLIQVAGGTYTNVASGTTSLTNLTSTNASLQALVNIGGGGTVDAVVTPLTTIATAMITPNSGLTLANYAAASTKVAGEFQLGGLNINAAPVAGDAYDKALKGVQEYLVAAPASTDDPNANNLLTWNLTASNVQGDYTSAYNVINNTALTFTFY
ncbi:MAG: hypothetical protein HIU89_08910 [Proteobacteria bacterium]|nr:hypothetical protein [Pseudomonadota bacterium]